MSDVAVPANTNTPTAQWWVQVRGQSYGPYQMEQLHRFVEEGRIRASTPVSDKPEAGWVEARRVPGLLAPLSGPTDATALASTTVANVFVSAEILTGAWPRFMTALKGLGQICELTPGLWLLRTRFSAGVVRNTLSQTLERGDRFVVIDATRDRLAWFNLGPEVDVRINGVWNK